MPAVEVCGACVGRTNVVFAFWFVFCLVHPSRREVYLSGLIVCFVNNICAVWKRGLCSKVVLSCVAGVRSDQKEKQQQGC